MNIGSEDNPKLVTSIKCCNELERNRFLKLLKEFRDVFTWPYEDLKYFCQGKFKHQIPLKLNVVPFLQNLRNYNSRVAYVILKR